jgi:hypothetical protein
MEVNAEKTKLMRIARQQSSEQVITDQKTYWKMWNISTV